MERNRGPGITPVEGIVARDDVRNKDDSGRRRWRDLTKLHYHNMCPIHNVEQNLYCVECSMPVCESCALQEGHGRHPLMIYKARLAPAGFYAACSEQEEQRAVEGSVFEEGLTPRAGCNLCSVFQQETKKPSFCKRKREVKYLTELLNII